jgi:uncharacterized phage protein (TIGR01671 family)
MNREIRFRGKSLVDIGNIKKGDWVYGGISYDTDRVWIDMPYYGQILVDKDTVGQYTGLKDENGKEIYEGDIVKIKYRDEDIGKVIYEHNGFSIDVTNMNKNYGRVSFVNNFMEVIGNIYDNPELLGGKYE